MAIGLTAKIKPKNDAFTGMVDADQVVGGGDAGTFLDACVAESNVTQHALPLTGGTIDGNLLVDGILTMGDHLDMDEYSLNMTDGGGFINMPTGRIYDMLDEDDMASNSDRSVVSQQSIKAYVEKGWHGSETRVKILPRDFMPNDDSNYYNLAIEDEDYGYGIRVTSVWLEIFAFIPIPIGYKATHVKINASQNRSVYVSHGEIDSSASPLIGNGLCNTEIDLAFDLFADEDNFMVVKVITTSTADIVYGGYVTIEEV